MLPTRQTQQEEKTPLVRPAYEASEIRPKLISIKPIDGAHLLGFRTQVCPASGFVGSSLPLPSVGRRVHSIFSPDF